MLLSFSVENWMSYQGEATLSMMASRERQHGKTLAKIPGFRSKRALPVAAIYGGNASGKTALFNALAALRDMVVRDVGVNGVLPVMPFALDEDSVSAPSAFDIAYLVGSRTYHLQVEATRDAVLYERLEMLSQKGPSLVYEREQGKGFSFNEGFFSESDHVAYAAKSTRDNRVFLGSAVSQNVSELNEAFGWFSHTLELVGVGSQAWSFAVAAGDDGGFMEFASRALSQLDTGIVRLVGESVGEDSLPDDAELRRSIAGLAPGEVITLVSYGEAGDYGFEALTIHSSGAQPIIERIRTVHKGRDGKERTFALSMESSGTKRLLGLLPMLFDLSSRNGNAGSKVYVVDELDRCLHTMLTKRLVEDFLATCSEGTRKQLLFTTHDLLLMDQSFMRRDEMYIAQRDSYGCSELVGLAEYEGIRFDKDLVRSYLDGRFGGIPMLEGKAPLG